MGTSNRRLEVLILAVACAAGAPGPLAAAELWVTPDGLDGIVPGGVNPTSFMWPVTGAGYAFFSLAVPADMASFVGARVAVLPDADSPAPEEYQVFLEAKRDGEVVSSADWSISLGNTATPGQDRILEVDIGAAFADVFDASSPGNDYVGVFFRFPAGVSGTAGKVLGLRFEYDPVPVDRLAVDSVGSPEVRNESLRAEDLASGSVGASEIATGAVGSAEVQNNSLTALDLGSNSVGNSEIQPGAVGPGKLSTNAVLALSIANDQVLERHIAAGAVGADQLQDGVVNGAKVQNESLTEADILDEAGADFTSPLNRFVTPNGTAVTVAARDITAPAPGVVIAYASGTIFGSRARVLCSITTGLGVDPDHAFQAETGSDIVEDVFGATRGFSQGTGTATYRFVCNSSKGSPVVVNPEFTLVYVPRFR